MPRIECEKLSNFWNHFIIFGPSRSQLYLKFFKTASHPHKSALLKILDVISKPLQRNRENIKQLPPKLKIHQA